MLVHVIFFVVAGLLGAVGLLVIYRAGFADRSGGQPRCPSCWYDMTGSRGFVCPECGHDARRQRNLLRTRRYRTKALLGALLIMCGTTLAVLPRVQEQGWTALIPTTALMIIMPWTDNQWFLDEADARVNASNPEWFRRHNREISEYGRFFAHRCAAIIDAGRPTRLRAVQLISDMRLRDDITEQALLRATQDVNPTVRIESLNALSLIAGADHIVDAGRCARRVAECLSDSRVAVRTRAARVFDYLRPLHPDAIEPLVEALADERPEVRSEVCEVLGKFGSMAEVAAPALTELIDDPSSTVGANAIRALGRLGLAATPAVDEIIAAIDADDRRMDAALRALQLLGPVARPAVPRLTSLLTEPRVMDYRRVAALEALLAIDCYDPEVLAGLEIASRVPVDEVRHRVASEIGRYRADEPLQVRILVRLLGDASIMVRQEAALSIGRLTPLRPGEIELLRGLAGDPEFIGWEQAQSALSRALEWTPVDTLGDRSLDDLPAESRR